MAYDPYKAMYIGRNLASRGIYISNLVENIRKSIEAIENVRKMTENYLVTNIERSLYNEIRARDENINRVIQLLNQMEEIIDSIGLKDYKKYKKSIERARKNLEELIKRVDEYVRKHQGKRYVRGVADVCPIIFAVQRSDYYLDKALGDLYQLFNELIEVEKALGTAAVDIKAMKEIELAAKEIQALKKEEERNVKSVGVFGFFKKLFKK